VGVVGNGKNGTPISLVFNLFGCKAKAMQLNKLKMTQNKENIYIICIFIEDTSIFIESIVNYCIN
jgi:hypothetical protein